MKNVAESVLNNFQNLSPSISMDYEGNYQVHYEKFEGNVYFYISDSEYLKRLAYRFLGEVREKYG